MVKRLHRLIAWMAVWSLSACSQFPAVPSVPENEGPGCAASGNPADNTRLASIQQTLQDGKLHAALAQLDTFKQGWPEADLMRADIYRRLDKADEAERIYLKLLGTCLRGRVEHGLGLIAASRQDLPRSLTHLADARRLLPTDANVRNDYGYALLLAGDNPGAQFEFLTALDLAPLNQRAASNLVLLSLIKGQEVKAWELAKQYGLDGTTQKSLLDRSINLKKTGQDKPLPVPAEKVQTTDPNPNPKEP